LDIREIGEFGLIERIESKLSSSHKDIIKGIGDDASVTQVPKGKLLLSTSDTLIEDVHFSLNFASAFNLGRKSLAVNISDIAAMGGIPRFFLISMGIPQKISVEFIDEFIDGIRDVALSFHAHAIGGDTTFSPGKLVIQITLFGEAIPGYVIYRNNANVGDYIYVTGNLGDSALGLKILDTKDEPSKVEEKFRDLVEEHNNPTPRVNEGRLIAENRIASAMIDISDGLISDLGHVCKQSKVGAKIWLENLPLSKAFQEFSREFTDHPMDLPLSGGEDYELLFTVDKGNVDLLNKIKHGFQTKVTLIGEIVRQDYGISVLDNNGQGYTMKKKGFDHFL